MGWSEVAAFGKSGRTELADCVRGVEVFWVVFGVESDFVQNAGEVVVVYVEGF